MWSPDDFVAQMLDRLEAARAGRRNVSWAVRREQLLHALKQALGDFGDVPQAMLASSTLEHVELETVIRERVEYSAGAGLRIPAYIMRPRAAANGKRPAILALHGHGWGSREMVGLLPDGRPNAAVPSGHRDAAFQLASRGFIVLVPELIGFGDRKLAQDADHDDPKANSCFPLAAALLLAGKTLAGLRVFEASRAIDYLLQRFDVDAGRIGIIGFSGGGMIASLTAALDERVGAAAIYGYSNTYRSSILARRHCLDNYLPGILQHAEMPDLLALIAPRPLFLESGNQDHLFPETGVREAARRIAEIYREMDALTSFEYDIFPGGHEMNGRRSFDWLQSVL